MSPRVSPPLLFLTCYFLPPPYLPTSCCIRLLVNHLLTKYHSTLSPSWPLVPLSPFSHIPFSSSRVTGYLTLNSGQQADHRSSLCHCSCSSCGCSRRHHSRAGGTRYHGGSPRACHPSHPAPCLHLSLTLWTSSSSVFPLLNLLCYPSLLSEHGSSEHDGWQHC